MFLNVTNGTKKCFLPTPQWIVLRPPFGDRRCRSESQNHKRRELLWGHQVPARRGWSSALLRKKEKAK